MKTKDRIKEEIGFEKLLMTIASALFTSSLNWLFANFDKSVSEIVVIIIGMIFFLIIMFFFLQSINTKIKDLDYD